MNEAKVRAEIISRQEIEKYLPAGEKRPEILIFDCLDSTNTYAAELFRAGAEHGTAVIAREQSAGRGRNGNSFFSPRDTGLYMSLILCCNSLGIMPQQTTIAAAVAARRGICKVTGVSPSIKWVNDLYYRGRKICGILAEGMTEGEELAGVVVGIGINCTTAQEMFPPELREKAGSLGEYSFSTNRLAAEIMKELLSLSENSGFSDILEEYRSGSPICGKRISFMWQGETVTATAEAIDRNGNLVARQDGGETITLPGGEVSVLGEF